jgi:multiple sugar transport system substrate-binding protein
MGLKDGFHLGYLMPGLFLSLVDSPTEYFDLFAGDASFTDPAYAVVWERLQELKNAGCINEDVGSIDFFEATSRFTTGNVVATTGNASTGSFYADEMGADVVGLASFPTIGDGGLGGAFPAIDQKLAVTSWSTQKEEAAAFLKFLHTPERMQRQYELSRAIPLDDRFDTSILSEYDSQNLALADSIGTSAWLQAINPAQWEYGTLYTVGPQILLGEYSPTEGAGLIEQGMEDWRTQQPDAVVRYAQWEPSWT